MHPLEKSTLGAGPTLAEVGAYYQRPDILAEIASLTSLRDVELIYRTLEGQESHLALEPQTPQELQIVFRRLFEPTTQLSPNYYPWLHCWSNRAYQFDKALGLRRLIGFDSGRELDLSWRRSFAQLYPGMAILDELGIYYRLKFSGHRSLHLCIPAEAVPQRYRHAPDGNWNTWRAAVNTIGAYIHRSGCGDSLWARMAGEEPFTGVYSLHRTCGLVSAPLLASECRQFRPWMATVHLAAPLPRWWDIPPEAQENFQRAVDRIRAGTQVFDMGAPSSLGPRPTSEPGYISAAIAKARRQAAAYTSQQHTLESNPVQIQRIAWCTMVSDQQLMNETLQQILRGDDETARWFALETLCTAKPASIAKTSMLHALQHLAAQGHRYVCETAEEVLVHSGEAGIIRLLKLAGTKRQWKKDGRGPRRRRRRFNQLWALQHYVETEGENAAKHLGGLADQGSIEVCRAVCAILERCGEIGLATLISLLSSKNQDARRESIVALLYRGKIARPSLERAICQTRGEPQALLRRILTGSTRLLKDETLCWTMRPATLATVVELGTDAAVETLGQILLSGKRREAYHASRALVFTGPAAIGQLQEALHSPTPLVRRRACEALRDLAVPQARQALRAALDDLDGVVRLNAVRGLNRLGDHKGLAALSNDPSRAIRRTVRKAQPKAASR